jgi:hypothetical protein
VAATSLIVDPHEKGGPAMYEKPTVVEVGKAKNLIQGTGRDTSDNDLQSRITVCDSSRQCVAEQSLWQSMVNALKRLFG